MSEEPVPVELERIERELQSSMQSDSEADFSRRITWRFTTSCGANVVPRLGDWHLRWRLFS